MKKAVIFGSAVLVVVAVCLVLLSVSLGVPHRVAQEGSPARPVGLEESNGPSACRPVTEQPVYKYPVDPETREVLRKAYDGIATAYSNRQTTVMRQIFSGVKDRIRSLKDADFLYVEHCAYSAYLDALFVQRGKCSDFRPPDDFSDVRVFKPYAEALLELVRIIADGDVARQGHDGCKGVEALPLRLLKEYKKKFGAAGRRALEACADQLIAEWITFIESDEGYSHGYARWVFPYNLKIHEHGSREDAVKITRLDASGELVVFAGYTPKWLEEIK